MNRLSQRLLVGLVGAGAGLAIATGANAAPTHQMIDKTPSGSDVHAAHQAADTPAVRKTLAGFFADRGTPGAHHAPTAATVRRMDPQVADETVPVYYLNPKFVAADSADVPVANLAYLATGATSADGQHAVVWTARNPKQHNAWAEVNIASGNYELSYAKKAGPDAVLFREPQINAWYALRDHKVLPLNKTARSSVGVHGTSVAAYQKLVHQRYADKQAGSEYARKHAVGGFNAKPLADGRPHAAQASADSGNTAVTLGTGLGAAGLLGAAGALALRRRSRRSTD